MASHLSCLPMKIRHLPILILHVLGVDMVQVKRLRPRFQTYFGKGDLEGKHAITVGHADDGPDETARRKKVGIYSLRRWSVFPLGRSRSRSGTQTHETEKKADSDPSAHMRFTQTMPSKVPYIFPLHGR